jgi:hypothetical protein
MAPVQLIHNPHRVDRAVEEVWIAEGNVFGSCRDLLVDVLQHDLGLNDPEPTLIDRNNRAVPTEVPAAPARLGVTRDPAAAVGQAESRVSRKRLQARTIGHHKLQAWKTLAGLSAALRGAASFALD